MGRSRYTITEANKPHFMTCTVVEWLPVFTRPETVNSLLNCWQYQRQHAGLKLWLCDIRKSPALHRTSRKLEWCVSSFKSYTARQIIDHLETLHVDYLLKRFRLSDLAKRPDRDYQFWQEGVHAELVFNEAMMRQKLDYIPQSSQTRLCGIA